MTQACHDIPGRVRSLTRPIVTGLAVMGLLSGCSVRQYAIRQIGSSLAEGSGGAFAAESDPEFAGQAVPFSLKLIESLLWNQPDNVELLEAAAAGFTQYGFVWVQQPADFIEADDFARAQHERGRARAFYLRAHDYAMRGLETRHAGFPEKLRRDPAGAVAVLTRSDVPLVYWAAASLGSAITLSKTDPAFVARQAEFFALVERASALDPDWGGTTMRELVMVAELARPGGNPENTRHARALFERIVADSRDQLAGPFVTFAETVSVQQQDRAEFVQLLERALAIDTRKTPRNRLANVVMQQRARWLLERVDELFLE